MAARTPSIARRLLQSGALACAFTAAVAAAESGFDGPHEAGIVASGELTEISGLASSRRNAGVLWAVNDSGDSARVYAIATDGALIATYLLAGAKAEDYEALAVGPGPRGERSYLYVGDIGDNLSKREAISVYRLPEPDTAGAAGEISVDDVTEIRLHYPDGAHDAEAMMCDPVSGDIFVVVKEQSGKNGIYRASASDLARGTSKLVAVGTVVFPGSTPSEILATGADIAPSGEWIAVRSYNRALLWHRERDQSIAQSMQTTPVEILVPGPPAESQGEAIAFGNDGRSYFTIGEGVAQTLYRYDSLPRE